VTADPHYGFFGLTLLPHDDAKKYYEAAGSPLPYDVAEFYTLAEYRAWLEGEGLVCEVEESFLPCPDTEVLAGKVRSIATSAETQIPATLVKPLRERMRSAVAEYVAMFEADRAAGSPTLGIDYGFGVFHIIAKKPA
jgi:hypothetical protein